MESCVHSRDTRQLAASSLSLLCAGAPGLLPSPREPSGGSALHRARRLSNAYWDTTTSASWDTTTSANWDTTTNRRNCRGVPLVVVWGAAGAWDAETAQSRHGRARACTSRTLVLLSPQPARAEMCFFVRSARISAMPAWNQQHAAWLSDSDTKLCFLPRSAPVALVVSHVNSISLARANCLASSQPDKNAGENPGSAALEVEIPSKDG